MIGNSRKISSYTNHDLCRGAQAVRYCTISSYVTKELPMYWQITSTLEKGVFFGITISCWDVFGKTYYHVIN
jgi:hypothetical protein